MQNCPFITIFVSHGFARGVGHGDGNWVSYVVDLGVGLDVVHWVDYGSVMQSYFLSHVVGHGVDRMFCL